MRSAVLLDTKIDKDEALVLLDEYAEFIEKHTGIKCDFYVERRDFSFVPTTPDSNGDLKPTQKYLKELTREIHGRYGDYGVDNIVMWVHEDNFTFRGIWGTNLSYIYYKYSVQLCRWDKDNTANSFGTLYHEQAHSFDAVIKQELGIDINPEFNGWDTMVVHGKGNWDYIRYQENTKALKKIAVRLKQAYAVRKEKHMRSFKLYYQIIELLTALVNQLKKK